MEEVYSLLLGTWIYASRSSAFCRQCIEHHASRGSAVVLDVHIFSIGLQYVLGSVYCSIRCPSHSTLVVSHNVKSLESRTTYELEHASSSASFQSFIQNPEGFFSAETANSLQRYSAAFSAYCYCVRCAVAVRLL